MQDAIGLLYIAILLVVLPGAFGIVALIASELAQRRNNNSSSNTN
jgi:hypothetical protein